MKPSDNRRHQLLKYLEDRANRTSSTSAAPPPYTTNPLNITNPSNTIHRPMIYLPDSISSHIEYDWDEPTPAAISITIGSSITIIGDKNTVSIFGQTNAKDIGNGQEQMGQLATTLINALKAQDLTEESGRKRPITVEFKHGIVIKGVDNKVCVGDTRSVSTVSRRTFSEAGTPDVTVKENTEAKTEDGSKPSAKRRCFQSGCE
ncbi:hypothetical protein PoHVEF18_008514 [Penicillium ochrochloron]